MNSDVVYCGQARITIDGRSFRVWAELMLEGIDGERFIRAFIESSMKVRNYLAANNRQVATLVTNEGRYTLNRGSISKGSGDMLYLDVSPASGPAHPQG